MPKRTSEERKAANFMEHMRHRERIIALLDRWMYDILTKGKEPKMHAYPCTYCCGHGGFTYRSANYHDNGPPEYLTEFAECPECDGKPLEPTDDSWCHLCDAEIGPDDFTRIDRHGYEVHADCTDRNEDDAPDLPEPDPEDLP